MRAAFHGCAALARHGAAMRAACQARTAGTVERVELCCRWALRLGDHTAQRLIALLGRSSLELPVHGRPEGTGEGNNGERATAHTHRAHRGAEQRERNGVNARSCVPRPSIRFDGHRPPFVLSACCSVALYAKEHRIAAVGSHCWQCLGGPGSGAERRSRVPPSSLLCHCHVVSSDVAKLAVERSTE